MLHKLLRMFEGSVKDALSFKESALQEKPTVFDFDLSNPKDPEMEFNLLKAMLALGDNYCVLYLDSDTTFVDQMNYLFQIGRFYEYSDNTEVLALIQFLCDLNLHKTLHTYWSEVEIPKEFLKNCQLIRYQQFEMEENDAYVNITGSSIDPYVGLLQHSCHPNIRLRTHDGKIVWMVDVPIKAGEMLTRKLKHEFMVEVPEIERNRAVRRETGFFCECIACKEDWPPLRDIPCKDPEFVFKTEGQLMDRPTALEEFKKNCDYINTNYSKSFPSKEVCYSMAMNAYKFAALTKPADFYI